MIRKEKIYLAVIFILFCLCCILALKSHKLYANEQNLLQAYINESLPGIACIGDSLTHGTGGEGISYPDCLEKMLWEDSLYIPVNNLGVGGENTVTIAGRMGAIPYRVEAFTIPADAVPVQVRFISEENKKIEPLRQGEEGINPCVIEGVEGRLSIEQENYMDSDYTYYFTRKEAGAEVEVESGSEVRTNAATAYCDDVFVVFIGQNRGYENIEELITQQKAILALQRENSDKFLVLGLTSGTADERKELEEKMETAYDDKYINLRDYLSTEGPYDADVKITEEDLKQMSMGQVPDCLLSDGIHFNKEGYRLIAKAVYERMHELGYFDEVLEAAELYGKRGIDW